MGRRYGYRRHVIASLSSLVLVGALVAIGAGGLRTAYKIFRAG
jgi:hypothetical protein